MLERYVWLDGCGYLAARQPPLLPPPPTGPCSGRAGAGKTHGDDTHHQGKTGAVEHAAIKIAHIAVEPHDVLRLIFGAPKDAQSLRPDKTVVLSAVDMTELNQWIEDHLRSWNAR